MRRAAEHSLLAALAAAAAAAACPLAAQNADPLRPPRILDTPAAPAAPRADSAEPAEQPAPPIGPLQRPPNAARLAPLPEQRRAEEPEEIVVIGQGWRLPDLGSEWRARQREAANEGRFAATLLPLYDPNEPPLRNEAFKTPEQRRHGYIELFRLRFGRRSRE